MEFSSQPNNDFLKSNRFSIYANKANNNMLNIFMNENISKAKSTPRKCKTNINACKEATLKKSSSLHNMVKVGELNEDNNDIGSGSINIDRGTTLIDKQQIYVRSDVLSKIEKEKTSYEARISELILSLETNKKERDMFSMENVRLTDTVQNLQMDVGKLRDIIEGLKTIMSESGLNVEKELMMEAGGDGGTVASYISLNLATMGDTASISSDEWIATAGAERDFLASLSVSTLQDRIQKMEEDSYCTNEELQATMQELVDLQHKLDALNEDNRNITFDRTILLESLCEQTRKLQQVRSLSNHLKFLLLSGNSHDYPNLDAKLRELYAYSEEENCAQRTQIEAFKQTIITCQSECREMLIKIESLTQQLVVEQTRYSQLQEKFHEELWKREQVETVLKTHSELFDNIDGWTDCSSGVLALIQQSKCQKKVASDLKIDLMEKVTSIEGLHAQIRQLEDGMLQGMKNKEEYKGSINHMQSQLEGSEREIHILSQTLDTLREKYADDAIMWRSFERDLLTSITAANSLKEEKDKELIELDQRLQVTEQARKELQERVEPQKLYLSNQTNERVLTSREQNPQSNKNSVKTLIQSLEYQMKPESSVTNSQSHISTRSSLSNDTNTVPRSSLSSNSTKNGLIRTNTIKCDTSPLKHTPEITFKKSSSFRNEFPQKQLPPPAESSQGLLQPLTSAASEASSILQSVSRKNSSVINPILEHHSKYQSETPSEPSNLQSTTADPLAQLVKVTNKGSKRNALLYWCQTRTSGYQKIDVTNFSSSWNDGLALCALLHSFDPALIDYKSLAEATPPNPDKSQKRNNFRAAFSAAERLGIPSLLDIEIMVSVERPIWNLVMNYVVEIYVHFESQK